MNFARTSFESGSTPLAGDCARTLLRRLRDLNLSAGPIAITREVRVVIAGCLSLDGPAESGVRYLVRSQGGQEQQIEICWTGSNLALALSGVSSGVCRTLNVPVVCDRLGRACAPSIAARVAPDSTDPRALEHFLRRVVRALVR